MANPHGNTEGEGGVGGSGGYKQRQLLAELQRGATWRYNLIQKVGQFSYIHGPSWSTKVQLTPCWLGINERE